MGKVNKGNSSRHRSRHRNQGNRRRLNRTRTRSKSRNRHRNQRNWIDRNRSKPQQQQQEWMGKWEQNQQKLTEDGKSAGSEAKEKQQKTTNDEGERTFGKERARGFRFSVLPHFASYSSIIRWNGLLCLEPVNWSQKKRDGGEEGSDTDGKGGVVVVVVVEQMVEGWEVMLKQRGNGGLWLQLGGLGGQAQSSFPSFCCSNSHRLSCSPASGTLLRDLVVSPAPFFSISLVCFHSGPLLVG
ncbi:hypothetical protein P4O66_019698 [Electrophorus voltai]|uniref:Uncharacterized protein n=1 Tax=Electrophorus voltai TaxID=2609070 RepID=A0AAD9E539_9TELE|nr:hypothetical protein P4O66_019698 [Electrophorus voltai]